MALTHPTTIEIGMKHSKEYEQKRNEILKDLYGWNDAQRVKNAHISCSTQATLYLKCMIQDVLSTLYSLHELLYGTMDDKTRIEFCRAVSKLNKIADRYIIKSISENIGYRDFDEI